MVGVATSKVLHHHHEPEAQHQSHAHDCVELVNGVAVVVGDDHLVLQQERLLGGGVIGSHSLGLLGQRVVLLVVGGGQARVTGVGVQVGMALLED